MLDGKFSNRNTEKSTTTVRFFEGTHVPVKALFENLERGARVDDFLEWFPGETREQAEAVCGTPSKAWSRPEGANRFNRFRRN